MKKVKWKRTLYSYETKVGLNELCVYSIGKLNEWYIRIDNRRFETNFESAKEAKKRVLQYFDFE